MIRLFLLFATVSLLSATGHAQETDTVEFASSSRMISYEDLLRLDPANRELYLNELRVLMMEMEEYQELRGQVQPSLFKKRETARFDYVSMILDYAYAAVIICAPPKVQITDQQGRRFCTTAQMSRYIRESQRRAAQGGWSAPLARGKTWSQTMNAVLPSNFRVRPGSTFSQTQQRYVSLQIPQTASNQRGATTTTNRNGNVRSAPVATVRAPASGGSGAQTKRPRGDGGGGGGTVVRRGPAPAPEIQPRNVPPIEAVESCSAADAEVPVKTGLTCNAETVNRARGEFRGSASETCVYAGHLRRYRGGRAQPGQCEPITRWCINNENPEDCQVPADRAQSFTPVFSCSAGQVLCNPVLFGVRLRTDRQGPNRFQAYCVPKGSYATRACYEKMGEQQANTEHLDLNNLQGEAPAGSGQVRTRILGEALDQMQLSEEEKERLGSQLAQLPRMWNQLANGLTNMCINDRIERQVFCEECYFIRLRLSQMGFLTSPSATSSCTTIKKVAETAARAVIRAPADATAALPGSPQLRRLPDPPAAARENRPRTPGLAIQ